MVLRKWQKVREQYSSTAFSAEEKDCKKEKEGKTLRIQKVVVPFSRRQNCVVLLQLSKEKRGGRVSIYLIKGHQTFFNSLKKPIVLL